MVQGVKAMGLETCMTLGMLTDEPGRALEDAGLDYYNHNIDTSPEHYGDDHHHADLPGAARHARGCARLRAWRSAAAGSSAWARRARIASASSTRSRRFPRHPESVPINALVPVKGTVLGDMLGATIRRSTTSSSSAPSRSRGSPCRNRWCACRPAARACRRATQALCFLAGANRIFTGDKLLTAANAGDDSDAALFAKLGLKPLEAEEPMRVAAE